MINIKAFLHEPLNFNNKLQIYPPIVKEAISNDKFQQYITILTIDEIDIAEILKQSKKESDNDTLDNIPTPFTFLLANCYHSKQYYKITKEAFKFFCHVDIDILFDEKKILIGTIEENLVKKNDLSNFSFLIEEEYFDFQNFIRESIGLKTKEKLPPIVDKDPAVCALKEKVRQHDLEVERLKRKKNKNKKDGINFETCLVAICCMGIGITPLNIGEMSYASVNSIFTMMQNKEKYETDIRSLLAGADPKKVKPVYWIKNF